MKRLYIITVLVALLSVSCNDWLDVRPDTEQKTKICLPRTKDSKMPSPVVT